MKNIYQNAIILLLLITGLSIYAMYEESDTSSTNEYCTLEEDYSSHELLYAVHENGYQGFKDFFVDTSDSELGEKYDAFKKNCEQEVVNRKNEIEKQLNKKWYCFNCYVFTEVGLTLAGIVNVGVVAPLVTENYLFIPVSLAVGLTMGQYLIGSTGSFVKYREYRDAYSREWNKEPKYQYMKNILVQMEQEENSSDV